MTARTAAPPGMLGGNRRGRIYGRLDCRAALRALARGGYRPNRVFFLDEATAIAAGYRPCAVCMPRQYRRWRADALGIAPHVEVGTTAESLGNKNGGGRQQSARGIASSAPARFYGVFESLRSAQHDK